MRRLRMITGICAAVAAPAIAAAAPPPGTLPGTPPGTPQDASRNVATSIERPDQRASLAEQAAHWGLSSEDYQRYLTAMDGVRGRISDPRITPIEVLGIESRSDAERRRYAELYVAMMRADTEKVLAYSRAVQEAWDRLHPGAPLIDLARVDAFRASRGSPLPPLAGGHGEANRLIVFTRTKDCRACDETIHRVLRQVGNGRAEGADIYVLDVPPGHDDSIRRWARSLDLPPDLVASETVTLNYETGQLQQVAQALRLSPAVIPFVASRSPSGTLAAVSLPAD